MPAPNRQFGASGDVVSCDTSQDFGSFPPVRVLPIPPPVAKLLKRCMQCRTTERQCRHGENKVENFAQSDKSE